MLQRTSEVPIKWIRVYDINECPTPFDAMNRGTSNTFAPAIVKPAAAPTASEPRSSGRLAFSSTWLLMIVAGNPGVLEQIEGGRRKEGIEGADIWYWGCSKPEGVGGRHRVACLGCGRACCCVSWMHWEAL